MTTKPILLWPRDPADIGVHLRRTPDDFLVVDTSCIYELRKLYKTKSTTPIFDPFPGSGEHYQEFRDHIANDRGLHIVGLGTCQNILQAQRNPSLSHASIEELLTAILPDGRHQGSSSRWMAFGRRAKDWFYLNWSNTILAALLVFIAVLIGNLLFPNDRLIEAAAAAFVFTGMYICAGFCAKKAHLRKLFDVR